MSIWTLTRSLATNKRVGGPPWHPFHVRLDGRTRTDGVIMCDQARMLDLASRKAAFEEKAPADLIAEAVDLIIGFVEMR